MSTTLCPRCLTQVATTDLVSCGGLRVCRACADVTAKAPAKPRGADTHAPGYAPRPTGSPHAERPRIEGSLRARLRADMEDWCIGRIWWLRVPVLVYLAYVGYRYTMQPQHPPIHDIYVSWFDGINLGIHELGHGLFRPFGRFMHIFGATLLQCLAPIIAGVLLLRQRDHFGGAFALGWLATNFFGVALYMADAVTRALPLVAPGIGRVDASMHDWWNLLGMLGLRDSAETLAGLLKGVAVLTMLLALWWGIRICLSMARVQPKAPARH